MYEPFAKNSITERVLYTGIVSEDLPALETWKSVSVHAAPVPHALSETGPAHPDQDRRPLRPTLHAVR